MADSDHFLNTFLSLRGRLTRFVTGIVPPSEVEDIVQETFVRLCQVKSKGAIRQPQSYMFRTAKNLAIDHNKRSESRLATATNSFDEVSAAEFMRSPETDNTYAQVLSDEEFVLFCEAVRELPKQCRRAFVLKKVYGYTLKEIMAEMGVGQPTVETHIVNGTKKCVQYLRERHKPRKRFDERLSTKTNNTSSTNGWRGVKE